MEKDDEFWLANFSHHGPILRMRMYSYETNWK